MLRRRIPLAIALAGDGTKAPIELRLFAAGWIDTTKGMYLFDAEAAAQVMKAADEWGNRYSFDYQHAVIDDKVKPEDKKGAGSFLLELRATPAGPELWAIDIQWAGGVAEAIERQEWLYVSPLFYYDESTRRINELINVALTNDPATKNMSPLMAATRLAALGMSHEQIRGALQSLLSAKFPETESESNWLTDVYDSWFVFSRGNKLWRIGYEVGDAGVALVGDVVEVRMAYEPVVPVQELSRQRGGLKEPVAPKGKTMNIAMLIAALGLKPGATEEEVLSALQAHKSLQSTLLAATGAESPSAALGMIEGWKSSAEALAKSQAEVAKLTKEARERSVAELLAKGRAAHKVTPGMEASLNAKGLEDPEWLEAHINALPVHLALAGTAHREPQVNPTAVALDGKKWEDLKPAQRAELFTKNRELYEALKADHQARTSA